MFSLLPKRTKSEETPQVIVNSNDQEARVVIDEDGTIVFASAAFLAMAGLGRDTIATHDFDTIFKFENRHQRLKDIAEGAYQITPYGTDKSYNFHCSWVKMPDKRSFLVAAYNKNSDFKDVAYEISKPNPINVPAAIGANGSQVNTTSSIPYKFQADIDVFLNLSREMMVVIDNKGKILRANNRFAKTMNYTAQELDNLNFYDLCVEDDKPHLCATLQSLKLENPEEQVGQVFEDCEVRIQNKGGKILWIEWRTQSLNDLIYCTGRDVTAIKVQEEALHSRERQLTQAESIARMGHWRWVLGEGVLAWSAEIFNIFGVDQGSFERNLENMNRMVHRDDIDRVNQALQRAIIEENDYDVEFCIIRPDGEERFIRSEGRCSRDAEGDVYALFGIMQDMTERMVYERELKATKDAAERAYAAKTQFLANMSHELRTPLNAIIGFSEMIERQLLGPVGNDKYLDYIGGIRESGEHLLDLISDILDMSKIEAGKYELALESVNIPKLMQLATHMMEGRASEAGVKLLTDLPPEQSGDTSGIAINDISIVADRRAVLQIILNLLSNAVKFSKSGTQVSLTCLYNPDSITLIVADKGIGIPANKLATITNPFEQVSNSYARAHEGSGLGLAITKELAELHHGVLKIESTINVGTTVYVTLPLDATIGMVPKQDVYVNDVDDDMLYHEDAA